MYIDFHIHAFVDSIAEKALGRLAETAQIKPVTNGTLSDTRKKLSGWGIDLGVLLPIATKPSQQQTINNWAKDESHDGIVSFGSVHPDAEDVIEELHRIKELGLKGIKFHPDYQNFFIFEDKMGRIYKEIEALSLPMVFHMGYDPLSPLVRHSSPCQLAEVSHRFPKLKIVAAHLGGMYAFEETLHYLAGEKNVWLDTAFTAGAINPNLFFEIVKKHSPDRILFGSDLPWHSSLKEKEMIENLPISAQEKEKIFHKNASELLCL